jgi:hypothetical protein
MPKVEQPNGDSEFTAEQVARSLQADALQIKVLREYPAQTGETMNCHVGRQIERPAPSEQAHDAMHCLLQDRHQLRFQTLKIAADMANIFDVPVTVVFPGEIQPRAMDDLRAGEV